METTAIANPFVIGKYVSDKYFCDREKETAFLAKQVENGRNVVLISPRRMGKTGLINHFFAQENISERYYTFFIDIYATTSLSEFVYLFGKAIYEQLKSKKTAWAERFFQIISSLRVGFKLDPHTGEPSFDIGLGDIPSPQTTLDEIFRYLEEADKPCIVAMDEFQQVGVYEEQTIEALLRTKIQQCKQTYFIFSGSKRHSMENMFNSSSKPFYQSAISMGLNPIPVDVYADFAERLFTERERSVERALIEDVHQRFSGCTWFVQMMMNELFALTDKGETCNIDKMETAWQNVVAAQEGSYKGLLSRLAPKQKILLQAVAKERNVKEITSATFIRKYNLQSASSVQSALRPLLKNDIIVLEENGYRIYDYFLADWLASEY